jgi:hypothetical protein
LKKKNKKKENSSLTKKNKNIHNDDNFFDIKGNKLKKRKIVEGIPIYTEKELKIGLGGGTSLCPFDCNCCF